MNAPKVTADQLAGGSVGGHAALEREHLGDPDKRTGIYASQADGYKVRVADDDSGMYELTREYAAGDLLVADIFTRADAQFILDACKAHVAALAKPVAAGELPPLPEGDCCDHRTGALSHSTDQLLAYGQQCADSRPAGGVTDLSVSSASTYANGPEGMPRVKRMPSAVLDCIIEHSLFRYQGGAFEGEARDCLYGLMHDTAEEALARVDARPAATLAASTPTGGVTLDLDAIAKAACEAVTDDAIEDEDIQENEKFHAGKVAGILRMKSAVASALAASVAPAAPDEPKLTTDEAREYLVKFMEQHFTDKTFHRYIRGVHPYPLAGDFAWQMATALRRMGAPVAAAVPELMRQAVATVVSRSGDDLRIGWLRPERCSVGTLLYCAVEPAATKGGSDV